MAKPDDIATEIVDRMNQLLGEMWAHNTRRMAEAGLSMPEAKAILHLVPGQVTSMRKLAAAAHASPSNFTVTVDRLESRGLVRREDAGDRRVRGVVLTKEGLNIRQSLNERIATDHPSLRGLDDEGQKALLELLHRIVPDA